MGDTLLDQGRFTSDGAARKIELPAGCDKMIVINETQWATTQSTGRGVRWEWNKGLTDAHGFEYTKADSANTLQAEKITSGGFTLVSSVPEPEAAVTATAITAANPAVVSATAHGYSVGDVVRAINPTAMQQIGGMTFEVTAVGSANQFTLGYLDASGFAAAATAATFRRLPVPALVDQPKYYPTAITQASSAVITLSRSHGFVVGSRVRINVPSDFGMVEMDGLEGQVTAVGTATITVDIDSSAFTAFAFPASGDGPFRQPSVVPAGSQGLYTDEMSFKDAQFIPYMLLGAGIDGPAGSSSDVIYWEAYRADRVSNS